MSAKLQLLISSSVSSFNGKNMRGDTRCSGLPAKFNCNIHQTISLLYNHQALRNQKIKKKRGRTHLLQVEIEQKCQIANFADDIVAQIQFDQAGHRFEKVGGDCFKVVPGQIQCFHQWHILECVVAQFADITIGQIEQIHIVSSKVAGKSFQWQ